MFAAELFLIRGPSIVGGRAARKFSSSFLTVLASLVTLLGASAEKTIAGDWPNFRGPNHDGISSETLLADQLKTENIKRLWIKNIGLGCSSVAITKGRLDFGTWEQIFYGEFDGRRDKRVLVKVIGE